MTKNRIVIGVGALLMLGVAFALALPTIVHSLGFHPTYEGETYETRFRDFFATHVVIDDEQRFVTGQNQNSGHVTAHEMMRSTS